MTLQQLNCFAQGGALAVWIRGTHTIKKSREHASGLKNDALIEAKLESALFRLLRNTWLHDEWTEQG